MRFDQSAGQSAADLVSELGEHDLAELIWRYGEDRNSRKIAAAVVKARSRNPIRTTTELAEVIRRATGGSRASIHPATRTFQALRIATNRELEALSRALDASVSVLTPGGRLAVISFHSLEDRMVKQFVTRESAKCLCPPEQPMCTCEQRPSLKPAGKAIRPSADEIARNPRSRSAILRVSERLPDEESLRQ
jgi:16S rRNA (cytosine1402-N4)-methyltransferase